MPVSTIKSKWVNGILTFFDKSTEERVLPVAPLVFYDDFLGILGGDPMDGTITWSVVEVNLNVTIAPLADGANGIMAVLVDADDNAEDGVIYFGDQRQFNLQAGCIFECRLTMHTLPTTGVTVVFGMAGDHNLDKDTVTEAAWFRLDASGALDVETDDTTNNNDDVTTGITLVADTYYIFRIDFTDISDVKFYVDGVRVASGTTFDMSNLTTAEGIMQPYLSMDKASGTGVADMYLDYVRVWSKRS